MGELSWRRPLHVLTLTPFYPSEGDEANGCFVAEPVRELAQFTIVSTVIAAQPLHRPRRRSSTSTPANWVCYPQLPGNFGLVGAGRFLYARLLGTIKTLHRQRPIDVIHAHAALPCGHAAALLSASLKIPFVVSVHGLDVFNACSQDGWSAGRRRGVSADVYRKAARVICVSGKVQALIGAGIDDKVRGTVVYNGTDTELFSPGHSDKKESPDGNTILIVGNLLQLKGHELVLKAIAQLKERYPGLWCRIVGEGPERERFGVLTKELGIDGRVEFLGRKDRAGVAAEMRRCAIFVLPSRYEALGCVYLEAMSCAKPVVACHDQGIEEIIRHGENGWLIPVDGLCELVQGLSTLIDSRELRTRIGEAGRQTVLKKLTLTHQARQFAEIYEEAVG
jgi:teichuronic acid biosynthesis glycosyltransferase TuaC